MENERVIRALKTVPEARLRIIDLVGELLDPLGKVDIQKALDRQPEVNLAVAEADAYIKGVVQTQAALERLLRER